MRINVFFTLANVKSTLILAKFFFAFFLIVKHLPHSVSLTQKIIFCVFFTLFLAAFIENQWKRRAGFNFFAECGVILPPLWVRHFIKNKAFCYLGDQIAHTLRAYLDTSFGHKQRLLSA
jgi:hypothetical protein